MKKYENKQVEGKVSKENRDMTRNLCFHDWLIVRELKVLDDMYDEMVRLVNYRVLDLYEVDDSDERQQDYDRILEERETLRAIYIQRRNELKAGFTDRQEHQDREVSEKGWRKSRIERLSDISRSGYVLSDKETKAALNKRFRCIDEMTEFKDDPMKTIYEAYKIDGEEDANELREMSLDGLKDLEWHKYTDEELKEKGIIKGTLAKGRLHPDDVGKELTPEMLNRVIWESAEEGE